MGTDDQLSMDLGVEVELTAWDRWVDPERHAAQARELCNRAALPAMPQEPWDFESREVIQLSETIGELLPDLEAVTLPENADTVDQLVCLIGEWFVRYLDARWIDLNKIPSGYNDCELSIYRDVKPGIAFKFDGWKACSAALLVQFVVENEFINIAELVSVAFWRHRRADEGGFLLSELRTSLPDHPPFI
ncbi:hypothetical protein SAMN04244553_4051 [Nocardia amikacinitolerans]|uniref:Uncharacterized protein n=1 Tax=Nocardia amikacinitolerans TaxID=756689 RepID=A0A285LQD2_9NOCA|nr:hypothetical protein [Nocardia amikacinitolerans]MCP2276931.1 hypothetical protein [Nocardia amikacinitolerans]SNY87115.1 hypothetical protein SAMN04244553_4051 [Nocardia amikacinitolerans]